MSMLELSFNLVGTDPIPVDHGYHLYGALANALPALHQKNGIAVHPIRGRQIGDRMLELCEWSTLVIRTAADGIGELIQVAGKPLRLGTRSVRIGVPQVRPLVPSPTLRSRLVTMRNGTDPERFGKELRRKLDAFGVSPEAIVTLGKRRTIRIKDKEVVGYEVILEVLTAEESLAVQENQAAEPALRFARNHMGCGVFAPARESPQ